MSKNPKDYDLDDFLKLARAGYTEKFTQKMLLHTNKKTRGDVYGYYEDEDKEIPHCLKNNYYKRKRRREDAVIIESKPVCHYLVENDVKLTKEQLTSTSKVVNSIRISSEYDGKQVCYKPLMFTLLDKESITLDTYMAIVSQYNIKDEIRTYMGVRNHQKTTYREYQDRIIIEGIKKGNFLDLNFTDIDKYPSKEVLKEFLKIRIEKYYNKTVAYALVDITKNIPKVILENQDIYDSVKSLDEVNRADYILKKFSRGEISITKDMLNLKCSDGNLLVSKIDDYPKNIEQAKLYLMEAILAPNVNKGCQQRNDLAKLFIENSFPQSPETVNDIIKMFQNEARKSKIAAEQKNINEERIIEF